MKEVMAKRYVNKTFPRLCIFLDLYPQWWLFKNEDKSHDPMRLTVCLLFCFD